MAPVRAVGTVEVGARWRRDNRPDFPGIAVWVDAVAEIEIAAECFEDLAGIQDSRGSGGRSQGMDDAGPMPCAVDQPSPESECGMAWSPLSGSGREPRPGLLLSVVRAGAVIAYPTPLPDPPAGVLAGALSRPEAAAEPRPDVLPVEEAPSRPRPRRTAPQKAYGEVRALVGVLVEILVGRRAAVHAARWTDPEVRGKLRIPRYARTASLKSVRLAESGEGIEALALVQDSGRTRVVALRFDRIEDSRWQCTALQAG
ncbi:hypothetical protein ABH926_009434 [Catenulispora sp. GP43]|uniref:Rv3235 family protein n=1 Tax=Catenulispora sp. GP43 TaxID=3156263 RepID=UPI0035124216